MWAKRGPIAFNTSMISTHPGVFQGRRQQGCLCGGQRPYWGHTQFGYGVISLAPGSPPSHSWHIENLVRSWHPFFYSSSLVNYFCKMRNCFTFYPMVFGVWGTRVLRDCYCSDCYTLEALLPLYKSPWIGALRRSMGRGGQRVRTTWGPIPQRQT